MMDWLVDGNRVGAEPASQPARSLASPQGAKRADRPTNRPTDRGPIRSCQAMGGRMEGGNEWKWSVVR
jgi:hypothetical protein